MFQPGNYHGILKRWGANKSQGGTPFLFLEFQISREWDGEKWVGSTGDERTVRMFTSPGAWPYTKEKLQSIGFDGDDFPDYMYGEGIGLRCEHDQYEGKTHEKWDLAGGGGFSFENDDQLCQKFKRHWKSEHGSKPKQAEPAGASADAGSDQKPAEDEIPF